MKKVIRLTESELTRLIKRIIKESEEFGDIDMSNLQNEIKDFVLRYGNVSNNATDDEIMDDLYSLRRSEDSDISRQAIRLTRRLS